LDQEEKLLVIHKSRAAHESPKLVVVSQDERRGRFEEEIEVASADRKAPTGRLKWSEPSERVTREPALRSRDRDKRDGWSSEDSRLNFVWRVVGTFWNEAKFEGPISEDDLDSSCHISPLSRGKNSSPLRVDDRVAKNRETAVRRQSKQPVASRSEPSSPRNKKVPNLLIG